MRRCGLLMVLVACGTSPLDVPTAGPPDAALGAPDAPSADADVTTIPRFSTTTHVDLAFVERISRFRSGVGHDFADSYETCRSMKHYLCLQHCLVPNAPPPGGHDPSWTTIAVRAPTSGTITRVESEQSFGTQLHIQPAGHPDFRIRIFHVTPTAGVFEGAAVTAGQPLGMHASDNTMSDVAVEQFLADGFRRISFFDTLTDAAFAAVQARGVPSREALRIEAIERDAEPLSCLDEAFTWAGSLDHWVTLAE